MALSVYYSFNLPVVIARPFINMYGPRQSARRVIPAVSQIAGQVAELTALNFRSTDCGTSSE